MSDPLRGTRGRGRGRHGRATTRVSVHSPVDGPVDGGDTRSDDTAGGGGDPYCQFKAVWVRELPLVKPEPTNVKDKTAVTVLKDTTTVGHVPAPRHFQFLRRDVNKAFAEVIRERVNRGAGYGLEVPCIYNLYSPTVYINRMRELVNALIIAEHLYSISHT